MAHIILRTPPSNEADVKLTESNGIYTISKGAHAVTLDPARLFTPFETVLVFTARNGFVLLTASRYLEGGDGVASVFTQKSADANPIAGLYFDASIENHVLVINAETDTTLSHDVVEKGALYELAATIYPVARRQWNKRGFKADLLKEVNPIDSLVALEQQLDLLSALVIQHFDGLSADKRPDWYSAFKSAVETSGTTSIRSAADNATGMAAHKARIRALQAGYLAARARL